MRIENLLLRPLGISFHSGRPDKKCRRSVENLLNWAESSIRIVAGELSYEFYGDPVLFDIMQRALDRGVSLEVIVSDQADPRSLDTLAKLDNGVKVYRLPYWPDPHFVLVDDRHIRLEEPHPANQEERRDYVVLNFRYGSNWSRRFKKMKKQATLLELSHHED